MPVQDMNTWRCDSEGCKNSAVQRAGDCLICDRHLCKTHLQEQWHTCPSPDDWELYATEYNNAQYRYFEKLCRRVNDTELCSRASSLRNGISCTVELSPKNLTEMMGNQNCHASIVFKDGVEWLARFRLTWTSAPPPEVRDHVLRSEVATMVYLQKHTTVPVPKVFDWACESDPRNRVGVGYILMEKVNGQPLEWSEASGSQRSKVIGQLVDIFLELEKHPFDKMGSLVFSETDPTGFEVRSLTSHTIFQTAGPNASGPFSSPQEGIGAILGSYLQNILNGRIQGDCLVEKYLCHLYRLHVLGKLWGDAPPPHQFFLKHPDDKGDHILVDEFFNIVAVIDWEWAQTVSKIEAFCSPCMLWPVTSFYEGDNDLAKEETEMANMFEKMGRDDIATLVENGRKVQRFFFALGPDSSFDDKATVAKLFHGLREALNLGHDWDEWKRDVLIMMKEDGSLADLEERDSCDSTMHEIGNLCV